MIQKTSAEEKIKIGLLVPITGQNSEMGKSIIKSVRLAINKIDNSSIEIFPRDTASNPNITLRNAKKLYEDGVKIIIGPIFNENLIYLDELQDVTFLSLTNKVINNPKNIISAGINADSQLKTIIKFQKLNEINKTIFLIPKENYKEEIERAIKQSKIKINEVFYYDSDPTKLTNQIEKITKYYQRKQNLENEIKRLENSNEINKEKKIKRLEKKDTLGKVNFDSIIISDFDNMKDVGLNLMHFFEEESCGQCTPCRVGTEKTVKAMKQENWNKSTLKDLSEVMTSASICGLGQAASNPLNSIIKHFSKELKFNE